MLSMITQHFIPAFQYFMSNQCEDERFDDKRDLVPGSGKDSPYLKEL